MSLGSKYYEINDFYTLLNAFINTHKATNTETKNCKERIMTKIVQLYNYYFDRYKKHYDSKKAKDKEKREHDYKQFEMTDNGDQEPNSTIKEETKTKKPDERQKTLWIKLNKNDFDSLTQDVYNNLNSNEFKTAAD